MYINQFFKTLFLKIIALKGTGDVKTLDTYYTKLFSGKAPTNTPISTCEVKHSSVFFNLPL